MPHEDDSCCNLVKLGFIFCIYHVSAPAGQVSLTLSLLIFMVDGTLIFIGQLDQIHAVKCSVWCLAYTFVALM